MCIFKSFKNVLYSIISLQFSPAGMTKTNRIPPLPKATAAVSWKMRRDVRTKNVAATG